MSHYPLIIVSGKAGSGKDTVGAYLKSKYNAESIALADPMKRLAAVLFGFDEIQLWGPSECRNAAVKCPLIETSEDAIDHIASDFCYGMGFQKNDYILRLVDWFEGQQKEYLTSENIAPRTVLQTLGTEWGRACDPDMWVRYAINLSKKLLSGGLSYHRTRGTETDRKASPDYVVITDGRFRNEMLHVAATNGVSFRIVRPDRAVAEVGIKGHQSELELDGIPRHFYTETIVNDGTIQDLYDKVDTAMAVTFGDDRNCR